MLSKLRFRPTLWPTLFSVPVFIAMVGLCIWQVQRLHWKENLIAERETRVAAEPVALPAVGVNPASLEYRRVRLEGSFLHDKELYLGARSLNGNPGYHVLTPFAPADGGLVLVDRGWVPIERKAPERRPEGQLTGAQTVEGIVRVPPGKAWMQPDNEPGKNMWFYVDLPAMAAASDADIRRDLYVDAGPAENPGKYPVGGQTRIEIPNDHLQYAITWGLLAVALAVIYVLYHLKLERERKP
ncbi:SURF1 family protein [Dongia deserti]|uniref:SURF1 family protein n=1 Tax=Dongia deserti TaxID=2268030 RepID=UPI0025474BC4|nr:SURF1 family protein [Dongia deserti]